MVGLVVGPVTGPVIGPDLVLVLVVLVVLVVVVSGPPNFLLSLHIDQRPIAYDVSARPKRV